MAIGASRAIREAGLNVPDDISVIGVDNHELSEYFDLTTMAQPAPELGRLGARMLLDALHADTRPPPVETIVPTQLIVRGTTARVG